MGEFLYRKELRDGGWLLDLGLFGSGLFVADAKRELRAGRDVIWEID